MSVCVTARFHLENENADIKQFQKISDELIVAKQIRPDYLFGLRIAYKPDFLNNQENLVVLKNYTEKLLENNIRFLLEPSVGTSVSLFQPLFDGIWACLSTKSLPVTFVIDGDGQFSIDNEQFLDNLSKLATWMIKTKSTYGCGARTHICLGEGDTGIMREIHETIINMLVNEFSKLDRKNVSELSLSDVPLAYKNFGDTLSGVTAINWSSPNFWNMYNSILGISKELDFNHFASHFYLVLKGAKLDRICSIYFPTNKKQPTKQWNVENVKNMIKTQSIVLSKTDVGNEYKNIINNKKTVKEISKFYPRDLVISVIELVKSAIRIKT